ncbi:MAG: cadherin-like beta sandwich domain-containing protein [Erysipelotrichaceae bacterium]|nr:cadherin-like beta sandwich domain-containing protein [Erysipelotrichaceae bacterium]
MKRKIISIILSFIFVFSFLVPMNIKPVSASGGLNISASSSSVSAGSTVTLTVSASSGYFVYGISASGGSGGSITSGLGKTSLDNGESTTFKVKVNSTTTISVSGKATNYETETESGASDSVTVSVKSSSSSSSSNSSSSSSSSSSSNSSSSSSSNSNSSSSNSSSSNSSTTTETTETTETVEETKSNVCTLSSLSVSTGTLSPEFSASTTKYTVDLDAGTSEIEISAKAKDSAATVSGTGKKELEAGENTFSIKCTAEDGSTKTYKITVNVDETPLVYTTYNDQKLGVVANQKDIGLPDGFEETSVSLEGEEVVAYYNANMDKTIVYLVDEDDNEGFYLYDEETSSITSSFTPITLLGRNLYVVDIDEDLQTRDGMIYQELTIDEVTLMGWVYEDENLSNYQLIMVMNDQGEMVLYQYEATEDSLQLYNDYAVEEVEDNSLDTTTYVFIATTVIAAIVAIYMYMKYRNFKNKSISAIKEIYLKDDLKKNENQD